MAELEASIVPPPPPPPVLISLLLACMSSVCVKPLLWQFGDLGSIFILTKFMPLLPMDDERDNGSGAATHSSFLIGECTGMWLWSGVFLAEAQITGVVRLQPMTLAQ